MGNGVRYPPPGVADRTPATIPPRRGIRPSRTRAEGGRLQHPQEGVSSFPRQEPERRRFLAIAT
ncbi:MAG TPA: hypothetical protein PLH19_14555 [Anaerolineae bacterium]|nr:hypothetical protein [Anaerolineae bacterium]HQH39737.1 hypothetical protein [Anaerolineae bacterium]